MSFVKLWDGTYVNPMHIVSVVPVFCGVRLYVAGLQTEYLELQAKTLDEAKEKADDIVKKIEQAIRDQQ